MKWTDSSLFVKAQPVRSRSINSTIDDLYRTRGAGALRLAYLLSGDEAGAEDIVQDAFTRVLARLRGIRDPEAIGGYLNRTIVNLAKNHHRGQARLRAFVSSRSPSTPEASFLPDVEERDQLHRELLALPYRQRAALVLRYCEDMSEADVAVALGTSPKAVRSLVGRGLTTLRNGKASDV